MAWKSWQLTFTLRTPLHIGYHKIGNVQRTRYYLPARNLWGASTERLTRGGFSAEGAAEGNYKAIGQWVKDHCVFSYFFLCESEKLLNPHYEDEGLHYGDLDAYAFERRFLFSHVTTALDAATTSAENGSLHEVEFIAPHEHLNEQPVQLRGYLFLDDVAQKRQDELWKRLQTLQVGGERRYGFGQLRLKDEEDDSLPDDYTWLLNGTRPRLTVPPGKPLLAHTLAQGVDARGQLEPLVGRETSESGKFGRHLTSAGIYWTPGTILNTSLTLFINSNGVWEKMPTP